MNRMDRRRCVASLLCLAALAASVLPVRAEEFSETFRLKIGDGRIVVGGGERSNLERASWPDLFRPSTTSRQAQ
jgi:hypothetical protein